MFWSCFSSFISMAQFLFGSPGLLFPTFSSLLQLAHLPDSVAARLPHDMPSMLPITGIEETTQRHPLSFCVWCMHVSRRLEPPAARPSSNNVIRQVPFMLPGALACTHRMHSGDSLLSITAHLVYIRHQHDGSGYVACA